MSPDLAIATNWLRDHWDFPPVRIHSASVDDGSAWGAPAFSAAFERWLGDADATTNTELAVECQHYWTGARYVDDKPCRDCNGTGLMVKTIRRFVYPMRAAMSRLKHKVHAAPGVVHPADFIYALALMDWNVEASCATVGLPEQRGEEQLLSAIRLLQARYGEQPYTSSRRKSENQLIAEAAAAA